MTILLMNLLVLPDFFSVSNYYQAGFIQGYSATNHIFTFFSDILCAIKKEPGHNMTILFFAASNNYQAGFMQEYSTAKPYFYLFFFTDI